MRIGITMRDGAARDYHEPRDALAHDWHRFMARALPEVAWLPLPNLGADVGAWIERWALDGVILSGGEDRGSFALRDDTEAALWRLCQSKRLRVMGICRGLQQLWHWQGGTLAAVEGHATVRHALRWEPPWAHGQTAQREVNSFHRLALTGPAPAGFVPFAWSSTGEVEAACDGARRCAGLMWHPERHAEADAEDVRWLRWFWLHEEPQA